MSDRKPMFDMVRKFFGDSQWIATQFAGKPILRFAHEGQNGNWVCIAHVHEGEERFVFYSIGVTDTPVDRRLATAEFITRANFGLLIGNFEMDLNDGEVRYKTSIDTEGDRLSTALLRQLVNINIETMDKYLPGFAAVIAGGIEPRIAVELVEGPATSTRVEG